MNALTNGKFATIYRFIFSDHSTEDILWHKTHTTIVERRNPMMLNAHTSRAQVGVGGAR